MSSSKYLFLLHLPPPVHGSSMVGQWIKESTLINTTFDCSYINLLASKTVSESGKVTMGKLGGMFVICFKLLIRLIFGRPNVCYLALTTTGTAFYRDVLLVAILKVFRVKRVYHLHNKGVAKASGNPINKLLYRFVFKKAKVILLSEYLYADVKSFVTKANIVVCPNGIPRVKYSTEKSNDGKEPIVLFLSNLTVAKGVYILLEALAVVKQKNISFKSVFVGAEGDINAFQFYEQCRTLNLTDHVSYVGKKYGQEKDYFFQQADLFVFPTYYPNECFPLVLLEAMQYSLPIISTFEGGIADVVEQGVTGYLVKPEDKEVLIEKIEKLLQNSELRTIMGKKGKERFEEFFTLEIFENCIYQVLQEV